MNCSFIFVFFSFYFLHVSQVNSCSEPPKILKFYVSHYAEDKADQFRYVTIYFDTNATFCEDFDLLRSEPSFTKTLKISRKNQNKPVKVVLHPTNRWLNISIRSVNTGKNISSKWTEKMAIDTNRLHPEPLLFLTTFTADSGQEQDNPRGYYLQPDFMQLFPLGGRIARIRWPMLFDYECCNSQGIVVFPASDEILNFPPNFQRENNEILKALSRSVDWVSVRHYTAAKCQGETSEYCIWKTDDSRPAESGQVIYRSSAKVYHLFFNPLKSILVWSQDKVGNETSFEVKMKFQSDNALMLSDVCPCASVLTVSSPAITLDWRSHYSDQWAEPGVLILSNQNSLWRLDSISGNCTCTNLHNFTHSIQEVVQIANDWENFYWLSKEGELWALNWKTKNTKKIWNSSDSEWLGEITHFRSIGAEMRPYAPRECYFPKIGNVSVRTVLDIAVITVNLAWNQMEKCRNIPKPPVDYRFSCKELRSNRDVGKVHEKLMSRDDKEAFFLTGLTAETYYLATVNVSVINQYPKGYYPYGQTKPETFELLFNQMG